MESIIRTSLVIKEINANLVRKYMRNNEKSTKTEVARYTFLSLPTVSSIIDNLLEKNEVKILGQNKSSGGRRAMLYAINPICALCAIVYITPYAIEYFISDLMGKVLFDGHKDIEKGTHIENIRQVLNELFDQYKPIKAIGIGVPAVVKKGVPVYCPEIPEIIGVNIKELCQDEFGVKIYVDRGYFCNNQRILPQRNVKRDYQHCLHIFSGFPRSPYSERGLYSEFAVYTWIFKICW